MSLLMAAKSQAQQARSSPPAAAAAAADHLIDFDDEHPVSADEIGGEPVDVQLSRSSSGAGSSTPRAISPVASPAADIQSAPHRRDRARQPMTDSRASTLAREPHQAPPEQAAPSAWSRPTAEILLDLDDLASPLPLPPIVRRRSPLQVGQWPVISSPPRPHASTPVTASAAPAELSRPPSSQRLSKKSPSTTSSIRELEPILGDQRPPSAADEHTAAVFGSRRGSAAAAAGPSPPPPPPLMPDVERVADDPDNEFEADDDDELDLRFLPGDFKSTNV